MNLLARLAAVLLMGVIAWLGMAQPGTASPVPRLPSTVYGYDSHTGATPLTSSDVERGPPRAYDHTTSYRTVGLRPRGTSARPGRAAPPAVFAYDHPVMPAQIARTSGATDGQAPVLDSDIASVAGTRSAANTGRVFTSADAHVADAANAIEAALPGRVVGVNGMRTMSNGLSREVDVDLGNLLVQVKSGNARGLTGQIGATQASTGTPTIGYAPGISDAAWRNAASQGIPILRSPNELLAYIREFG